MRYVSHEYVVLGILTNKILKPLLNTNQKVHRFWILVKLLFKKVWRIQTITQLNLCSLKRPIVIGDQGYNNLFNGLFVRKILLTTSVPAYNHVKKQTTRQLIGRTILTSNTCKNCCIQIFTCKNFTPAKIAASKFSPAGICKKSKFSRYLLHRSPPT